MTRVWNWGGQVGDGLLTQRFLGWRLGGRRMEKKNGPVGLFYHHRVRETGGALSSFEWSLHRTAMLRD